MVLISAELAVDTICDLQKTCVAAMDDPDAFKKLWSKTATTAAHTD